MLTPFYDLALILASMGVSLLASFTGLSLTRGINRLPDWQRKASIAMASFAIGGGIWSMHFVAMLAMEWPVPIVYDSLLTLASLLIAILLSGSALLVMHFARRTNTTIAISGAILGGGIVAMHYVGMSAMRGCLVHSTLPGQLATLLVATLLGILAIRAAYSHRSRKSILQGTFLFGISVVIVHFTALNGTTFSMLPAPVTFAASIANSQLALIVLVSTFLICAMFLLSTATFFRARTEAVNSDNERPSSEVQIPPARQHVVLPYERENRTYFADPADVAAVRAEGHYTVLYSGEAKLFCSWSISTVEERLKAYNFRRAHRSYLVNLDHIDGFERRKDNGVIFFKDTPAIKVVPVSRSRVAELQEALGM